MDDLICSKVRNLQWYTSKEVAQFQKLEWVVKLDIVVKIDGYIDVLIDAFNPQIMNSKSKSPSVLSALMKGVHLSEIGDNRIRMAPFIDMYETRRMLHEKGKFYTELAIPAGNAYDERIYIGFVMNKRATVQIRITEKRSIFERMFVDRTIGLLTWTVKPEFRLSNGKYFAPFLQNKYSMQVQRDFFERFDIYFKFNDEDGLNDVKLLCGCTTIDNFIFEESPKSIDDILRVDDNKWLIDTAYAFYKYDSKMRTKERHDAIFQELMEVAWNPARLFNVSGGDIDAIDSILE